MTKQRKHRRKSVKGKEFVAGKKSDTVIYSGVNRVKPSDIPMIKEEESRGMFLSDSFDRRINPHWATLAQNYINGEASALRRAYVIHRGDMHYLFMTR